MKKLLLVLSLTLFGATSAQAGFMIEPFIGYEMGDLENGTTKTDYTGSVMGARLGYGFLGLDVGVEYSTATGEVDSTPKADFKPTDLGVFASYTFPIMLRVYGTLFVDSSADTGAANDWEGDGMRLGVGFTGLPFIVINVEMTNRNYDTQGTATIDSKLSTYALVVSLPLP